MIVEDENGYIMGGVIFDDDASLSSDAVSDDVGELLTVCKQIEELRRMLIISEVIIEGSVADLALRDLYNKAEKVRANYA